MNVDKNVTINLYIKAKSNISIQNSFKNKNWFNEIKINDGSFEIKVPNYNEFIPSNILRRLSPILKNAITCAIDCFNQTNEKFDAIIVGTSLGCLTDTENFLITLNSAKTDKESLSPTAFIQSTHNTIGGQISLFMKNHSYNMTHSQNSLSFEVALIDATLNVKEGRENVLIGAIDEKIEFLNQIDEVFNRKNYPFSSTSTFFCLTSLKKNTLPVVIKNVEAHCNIENEKNLIDQFLIKNKLKANEIDLVLFSGINFLDLSEYKHTINYTQYSGFNYSNVSFAMDFGIEWLMQHQNKKSKFVLIINNLCINNLGLILLENI
jgi:3-oxoacyl-[acyl-carrier-protein] synthase II